MTIHDTVACEQQIKKKLVYRTNNVIPDTTLKSILSFQTNKHENSIQQTLV